MKLKADSTVFLLIDIQERLVPAMTGGADVVKQAELLLKAAQILGVPVFVTEQYPKGLGPTVPDLEALLPAVQATKFEKITYTALTPEVLNKLKELGAEEVVVFGMETHVCVWQTVRDLLASGYEVHVLADAVCSRKTRDRDVALDGLRQLGAMVSVSETALFDLLGRAGTPEFKAISKLIK